MTAVDSTVLGGRYVLRDLLGRGGMAQVFRARDTVLEREVAVKVFHQDGVLPDGDLRRGGEVRLLAGLSHPNLVMVFDAGRDESDPLSPFAYLVMELVDGTTLSRVLDDGPMPASRVAALGAQLAGALAYVHARGVVHRDIKPANVLLGGPDGSVAKLTDFGVARMIDSTRLTLHGTTIGTANYLSPEQATGDEVTSACDVYSLGLVLLECLTGDVAFPGHGVAAAVQRLHRDPQVPDRVDPGWRELIAAMTRRDPAARPSAAEVAARLHALADPGRADTAPTTTLPRTPAAAVATARRPRRRVAIIAAAAAAALVAAVIVISSASGTADPVPAGATTQYAAVAGRLGTDLRRLERAIPPQVSDAVATVARRAAVHDFHGAQLALSTVLKQLTALHASHGIDDQHYAQVAALVAQVSGDLMRGQLALDAASRSAMARAAAARQAAAARRAAARLAAERHAAELRAAAARRAAAQRLAAARRAAAARPEPKAPKPPKPHDGHGKHGGH